MEYWVTIFSSAAVSAIVSSMIGGWVALRSKKNEYANAYYKIVLDRRVAAYEEIEKLILLIKTAIVDVDGNPYHMLFSDDNAHQNVWNVIHKSMSQALWISDDIFKSIRELNKIFYAGTNASSSLIEFGKLNYSFVAELRTRLEKLHTRDMLVLHDVPGFLKGKRISNDYEPIPERR